MATVEVRSALDVEARQHVYRLVAHVQAITGHRPLSDQMWLDLVEGGRVGFAAVLAWEGKDLIGYCQLANGHDSWTLELVVCHDDDELAIGAALVADALQVVAESGGGEVHWWSADPTATTEAIAARNQLTAGRALFQMRVPLPLDDAVVASAHVVRTRPFERGRDEQAWILVNNAAFAAHPEQGGWDLATLQQRETQPWFDPTGFLLHERDGRLAAFCWTKVHAEGSPILGEIYVIAVHPDYHGLGLGKALTVAGLEHLAGLGITTGMLYVDRDNVAAVELYRRLGFRTHRTDRAFVGHVQGARPASTDSRGDTA